MQHLSSLCSLARAALISNFNRNHARWQPQCKFASGEKRDAK